MEELLVYLKKNIEYIDSKLEEYTKNEEPLLKVLQESINYSLYSGGKRIRPVFCFFVGDIFSVSRDHLTSLACSVEMIHTASLIMDDLPHMDDAEVRRGKPANHIVYGQDVAALATIGLLTRAYEVVLNDPELPHEKKSKIVSILARSVGINGMVGGQFVDLKFSNASMNYATLEYIHNYKTVSLFAAAGKTSAIVGDANDEEIKALEEYATNLGFAFQILDDLLDEKGNAEEVGKTLHKDKGNFISLFGVEKSRELVEEYTQKAINALDIFGNKKEKLVMLGQMLLKRKS